MHDWEGLAGLTVCSYELSMTSDYEIMLHVICIKCKASRLQLLWPCGNSLLVVEDMETMVNMVSESDHFCMDHVQCSQPLGIGPPSMGKVDVYIEGITIKCPE